jgi:hypothetical protein
LTYAEIQKRSGGKRSDCGEEHDKRVHANPPGVTAGLERIFY